MNPSFRIDPAKVSADCAPMMCVAEVTANVPLIALLWVWDRTLRPSLPRHVRALTPAQPAPPPPAPAAKAKPAADPKPQRPAKAAEPSSATSASAIAKRVVETLQKMRERHGDSWEQKLPKLAQMCEIDLPMLRTVIHEVNRGDEVQILEPHKRGWGHRVVFQGKASS